MDFSKTLPELKQQYIKAIYKEKAFLIKEIPVKLHHGGESHLYLNHNQFLSKYKNLKLLTEIYIQLIPKNIKNYKLGAVDSVLSPVLCGLLACKLKKDIVVTKEKKLEHGLESKVYGDALGEVVLIDDVTSTGSILINAINSLRLKGSVIRYAILSACRDLTAIDNLSKVNIKAFYIATYEEIIKTLWGKLTQKEKEIIQLEIKEKNYNWEF